MASVDEIWLTDFGDPYPSEPASRRPAVELAPPNFFGPDFPIVIVAPLATPPSADRPHHVHTTS